MVRGRGQFLHDVKLPGRGYAAFVRSPHAHAKITRIMTDAALQIPGAIAVLTPDDLLPHVNAVRPGEPGVSTYSRSYNRYPLPRETVTFSGEAVVAVVAQSRYIAEDMVDAVQVAYAPLPAVSDVDYSLAPDAPWSHAELADNILLHRRFGEGDVDRALAEADLVIEQTFTFPRQTAIPMEARGVIAAFDAASNRFTIWSSTRSPPQARLIFSRVLGVPEEMEHIETPSPFTFNGVKGVGEAGTVGAYAAVPNAVANALRPWGIEVTGVARQSSASLGAAPSGSAAAFNGPIDVLCQGLMSRTTFVFS